MRTVKAELGQHQKGSFPIAGRARLGRGRNVYATRRKQTLPVYEHGSARGDGDVSRFGFLAPNGLASERRGQFWSSGRIELILFEEAGSEEGGHLCPPQCIHSRRSYP